jgi:50S ribosomal subunit-associated GTPase HflX
VFLLSNKADECSNPEADIAGREVANKHGINFLRVSAKTGEGLTDFIANLATKIDAACGCHEQMDESMDAQKRPTIRIDEPSQNSGCGC